MTIERIILGLFLVGVLYGLFSEWANAPKCPHGIRNGMRFGKDKRKKCIRCQDEFEKQQAEEAQKLYYQSLKLKMQEKFTILLVEAIKQRRRAIVTDQTSLMQLSPKAFEDVVANLYRRMGYAVKQTPYSNDGGKDAYAEKNGIKYLIECKKYAANIGRPMIQKLVGAMQGEKVNNGIFVTTSSFSESAKTYAKKCNVALVDYILLSSMLREHKTESDFADEYTISCRTCGETVNFRLYNDCEHKLCMNSHIVRNIFWKTSPNEAICMRCGHKHLLKKGRYGPYYECTNQSCRYRISKHNYDVKTGSFIMNM